MKHFTILTKNYNQCFLCGSNYWIEWHHIFNASNRTKSTEYGLVVPLCKMCHNEAPNGVHHNKENRLLLKAKAQRIAMKHYGWDLDQWREIFGKSYI